MIPGAFVFLLAITPICGWVAFTDLKYMKIRNAAVIALLAAFVLIGAVLLPFDQWAGRLGQGAVVLIAGFALHLSAGIGAGDVKFAAAAAPFIAPTVESLHMLLMLTMTLTLAALVTHRIARATPVARRLAPDWASWSRAEFPFGLVLAAVLWAHLAVSALG